MNKISISQDLYGIVKGSHIYVKPKKEIGVNSEIKILLKPFRKLIKKIGKQEKNTRSYKTKILSQIRINFEKYRDDYLINRSILNSHIERVEKSKVKNKKQKIHKLKNSNLFGMYKTIHSNDICFQQMNIKEQLAFVNGLSKMVRIVKNIVSESGIEHHKKYSSFLPTQNEE